MRIKHILAFLSLFIFAETFSQEKVRTYTVKYRGDDVGLVKLNHNVMGDTVSYKMISNVNTRFIFKINVRTVEESTFQNGRLIYSAVNRTVNGNEKVRRETSAGNKIYNITREGKKSIMKNESIGFNLMQMYCQEPLNIHKVYSDNYQQLLPITKLSSHAYKVVLPDGNYNHYYYTNGICSKVKVFHSLYDLEMILQ
jgi:hypothetical protein